MVDTSRFQAAEAAQRANNLPFTHTNTPGVQAADTKLQQVINWGGSWDRVSSHEVGSFGSKRDVSLGASTGRVSPSKGGGYTSSFRSTMGDNRRSLYSQNSDTNLDLSARKRAFR